MEEDGDQWVLVGRHSERELWSPSLIGGGKENYVDEEDRPLKVRFSGPAKHWTDAIPIGNGRLGAMIWGGVPTETINLNVPKLSDLFPKLDDSLEIVQKVRALAEDSRKFVPLPVAFVSESAGVEVESDNLLEECSHKMSYVSRPQAGFDVKDIMSGIRAKVGVKKEGSKPPIPKGESSKGEKKRKLDDVEIVKVLKKDGCHTDNVLASVEKEVERKDDRIKVLDQKVKFEVFRALQTEKHVDVYADENAKLKKELSTTTEEQVKELEAAKERFMFDASKTVMESRIEMIKEYEMGQYVKWSIEDEVAMMNAFLGEAINVGEVSSKVQDAGKEGQVDETQEEEKKEG